MPETTVREQAADALAKEITRLFVTSLKMIENIFEWSLRHGEIEKLLAFNADLLKLGRDFEQQNLPPGLAIFDGEKEDEVTQ